MLKLVIVLGLLVVPDPLTTGFGSTVPVDHISMIVNGVPFVSCGNDGKPWCQVPGSPKKYRKVVPVPVKELSEFMFVWGM